MTTKRPGRLGGTKSKNGCNTCKIRRVRCGEEKPHCLRCTSTGRRCCYDTASPPRATDRLQLQLVPFSNQGSRERRAFEYYFHQAGPSISGVLDRAFWRGSVLQFCRLEPVVWDAIISLSALYERPPVHEATPERLINDPAAVKHCYHHEALVWYSRSLSRLQQRINQGVADLTVSLISCVLFIAIELLQGNRKAAQALYKQGAQMMVSALSTPTPTIAALEPIFRRIGTWVFIMDGVSDGCWDLNLAMPDESFVSIDEARNVLCGIVTEMKFLNVDCKAYLRLTGDSRLHEVPDLATRQQRLKSRLNQWYRLFTCLEPVQDTSIDGATALLLMTYTGVLIESEACLNPDQSKFDSYELEFARIVEWAPIAVAWTRSSDGKQPPFMFEMGVFLPLFITGLKCPFPQLRRLAIQYLRESPPAQGMFMCVPASHIMSIIVGLEENPTVIPQQTSDINDLLAKPGHIPAPENRTCDFSVSSGLDEEGKLRSWLHYTLHHFDSEGRFKFVERTIPLPVSA
ncbi:transcriptional regulator family: Fungal Specific TF [Penicillium atrosanguineum]|nr:transcriptional regulator family: Fungal Specific TF [Penicillium atrosanguineum]